MPEAEILSFPDQVAWETWLHLHQQRPEGIWLRLFKKAAQPGALTYAEALDVALCFGWIDGQKKSYDEHSWLQKFVPRRPRSTWSKVNRQHIIRLTEAGRMQPAGLAQVAAAQADGRWEAAYDSSSTIEVPADFQQELQSHPAALRFFESLSKQNRYALLFRIQTAKKAETRAQRIQNFTAMLERGEHL